MWKLDGTQIKNVTCLPAVIAGILLGISSAQAEPVWKFLDGGDEAQGNVVLVDDNREYLIDNVVTETGQIDIGDSLRGMATWPRVFEGTLDNHAGLNGNPGGAGNGQPELTSVFQLLVTGKTEVSPGEYVFTFGPDPSFAEAVALGLEGQAMMIFYADEDPDVALDYTDSTSPYAPNTHDDGTNAMSSDPDDVSNNAAKVHEEVFIATATNGEYFWALGFTGALDDDVATAADGEGWATLNGMEDNVLPFFDSNHNVSFEEAMFSLNRLTSPLEVGQGDGLALGQQQSQFDSNFLVDFNGSQEYLGVKNIKTSFEIASQSQLAFSVIPLPPAAAMGLLMLAGMGGMKLWRQRQEKEVA